MRQNIDSIYDDQWDNSDAMAERDRQNERLLADAYAGMDDEVRTEMEWWANATPEDIAKRQAEEAAMAEEDRIWREERAKRVMSGENNA